MAAPVQPNPEALVALAAPPAAPPVIPPAPAQPAPAADGGVAQAAQAAPVQQGEVCSWRVVFPLFCLLFMLRRLCLLASFSLSVVSFILHHVFFSFSLVSSRLSPISVPFLRFRSSYVSSPAGSIVICISSCALLNLVLSRPFDRLQRFAVRATIISVSQCSAVSDLWPCVRLLEVVGRGFGC